MSEDLDFTDDKWAPPTMKVRVDRLTGPEQRLIEEKVGVSLSRMEDPSFRVGDFSLALAYVMLKRKDPSLSNDELWKTAETYAVEVVNKGDVTPTSEGGSTPKSPSPDTSISPSATSVPSSSGSGTNS